MASAHQPQDQIVSCNSSWSFYMKSDLKKEWLKKNEAKGNSWHAIVKEQVFKKIIETGTIFSDKKLRKWDKFLESFTSS